MWLLHPLHATCRFYVFRRETSSKTYDYRRMSARSPSSRTIFGKRLRQARQQREWAQDELGVMAGLEESSSSARISRYESGIHEPPFQFVETVAKLMNVSPAYFYCPDDRLAELILIYSALSETKRQTFHHSIKCQFGNDFP